MVHILHYFRSTPVSTFPLEGSKRTSRGDAGELHLREISADQPVVRLEHVEKEEGGEGSAGGRRTAERERRWAGRASVRTAEGGGARR